VIKSRQTFYGVWVVYLLDNTVDWELSVVDGSVSAVVTHKMDAIVLHLLGNLENVGCRTGSLIANEKSREWQEICQRKRLERIEFSGIMKLLKLMKKRA
jgi:hypothetical protein